MMSSYKDSVIAMSKQFSVPCLIEQGALQGVASGWNLLLASAARGLEVLHRRDAVSTSLACCCGCLVSQGLSAHLRGGSGFRLSALGQQAGSFPDP